jgi:hypothetical protein
MLVVADFVALQGGVKINTEAFFRNDSGHKGYESNLKFNQDD